MNSTFEKISRRELFKLATAGAGSVLVMTLIPRVAQGAAAPGTTLKTTIADNHGHVFAAKLDQVLAAGKKTYGIQGSAFHNHDVDMTLEILKTLQETKVIDVESSDAFGHSHMIRFKIV